MIRGRPIPPLEITVEEKQSLELIVRRSRSTQAEARRAKAILLCAAGHRNSEVSPSHGSLSAQRRTVATTLPE